MRLISLLAALSASIPSSGGTATPVHLPVTMSNTKAFLDPYLVKYGDGLNEDYVGVFGCTPFLGPETDWGYPQRSLTSRLRTMRGSGSSARSFSVGCATRRRRGPVAGPFWPKDHPSISNSSRSSALAGWQVAGATRTPRSCSLSDFFFILSIELTSGRGRARPFAGIISKVPAFRVACWHTRAEHSGEG